MTKTSAPLAPLPVAAKATSLAERMGASPEIVELIRAQIAPDAPDDVIALYFARSQQLGVDPLGRMLFVINRQRNVKDDRTNQWIKVDNWQLQGSVDLFRAVAASTAEYAGQEGPFWCGPDGKWKDVWLSPEHPAAAKVGVLRTGFVVPLYATAVFSEYCQTNRDGAATGLWKNMPATMIAKCAEALALRKAFPTKLTGIYTGDEMAQAENTRPVAVASATLPAIASAEEPEIDYDTLAQIHEVAASLGFDGDRLAKGARHISEGATDEVERLSPDQGLRLLKYLRREAEKQTVAQTDDDEEVSYCSSCGAIETPKRSVEPHSADCARFSERK